MIISGLIQANRILADPLLVATNESYFRKSTWRTEADVLADKVIIPNNIHGTIGTHQHNMHFFGATKAFY